MFSFIGKLLGSDKAAESLIDNVSKGIDKLYYSSEEQAEDKAVAVKEGNQVYIEWLKSTTGSALARRFIAITVTLVWALQYLGSLILSTLAPWMDDPDIIEAMMVSSEVLQNNGEQGNAAFMIVLSFYYLGNQGGALIQAAVDKFTKKK
jgi:hypothetical protein